MKLPEQVGAQLARQWEHADTRRRLLLDPSAWPVSVSIGAPPPRQLEHDISAVRLHLQSWRDIQVGTVQWQPRRYRSATDAVDVPDQWWLADVDDWALATGDARVQHESGRLKVLLPQVAADIGELLVRRRGLWRDRSDHDVLLACEVTALLGPGMAKGLPLRALAVAGMDSKFLERHEALVLALLDLRFDNQASALGLKDFLGSEDTAAHWLLVVPLSPGLLPFAQVRVRARELARCPLPGSRVLLVENERCLHLLPPMDDTVAVLGAGLDLQWLDADWLRKRSVGYWGDMDTWGMMMLGKARIALPQLQRLLMDRALFDQHCQALAVREPVPADVSLPTGLEEDEIAFHAYLRAQPKGRVEQELLPADVVFPIMTAWAAENVEPTSGVV